MCQIVNRCRFSMTANEQGLLQGWNSLLVRPEPLLIKDIKVQVNKQKLNNVRPAQMKHNSDKMTIAPMSSQPCSKPNVVCRYSHFQYLTHSCLLIRNNQFRAAVFSTLLSRQANLSCLSKATFSLLSEKINEID